MKNSKQVTAQIRHSKALYTVAIYGFIILFALMIYPFLPIYQGSSPFQMGITKFNNRVQGNLIVTISMLFHSIILLVVFICMLSKIKKYQAGVGYSFYKLFRNTLVLFMITFAGFQVTGYIDVYYKSYGYEYWAIVSVAYFVGLILSFFARIANNSLRPTKYKSWFYFLNILSCSLLIALFNSAKESVHYVISAPDGYAGYYYEEINYALVNLGRSIFDSLIAVMACKLIISFAHACMPLNASFAFMSSKASRGKDSKLSYAGANLDLTIYVLFFFIFGGNELVNELAVMIVPFIVVIVKYILISSHNKKIDAKIAKETSKTPILSYNKQTITPATSVKKTGGDGIKAWNVDQLKNYNQRLDFKDKTTINKMCDDLCVMLNDHGLSVQKDQAQKVLAGILSSKVTFVKCAPDRQLINNFASTVSEFFAEEMFYEERLDESLNNQAETITEPAISAIPKQEEVQTPSESVNVVAESKAEEEIKAEEKAVQVADGKENAEGEIQDSIVENDTTKEDEPVKENTPVVEESAKQSDVQAVSEQPVVVEETEQEKAERLRKEAIELAKKEKHSMACGMFVAHYINNTFGMIFLNNTEQNNIEDKDSDVISAIALSDENVFVGNQKYCPQSECFSSGVMKIADNTRLVVFINDKEQTPLNKEWIRYSTIVDLPLVENKEGAREKKLDCGTSYAMVNQSLEEAQDTCYLTEDYWRKIDRMEEYLEQHTSIRFDNKLIRQMEKSIAAFIACGMDRRQALDAVLSEKIIPLVSTEKEKILALQETDLAFKLDELFGFENIPLTKKAIAEYGLKK